ncbi:MAG: FAD-binding oxidoreductase [Pseudomonadota bacterium]|nr:FAD-binding oxidoreductase [Pseudomonadota bacterium]
MAELNAALAKLRKTVGPKGWLDSPDAMRPYLEERRGLFESQAAAVVCPANTDEVAAVVKICHQSGIGIVPQGGNTGLCGGAVAADRQILLNLRRMDRIRAVDTANDTITVEAGCLLAEVQRAAEQANRLFPLSIAAEGSCQIGGNLATNAGGHNVLRYGNMRDLTLGVEVVLPDGRIWNGLSALRKDNTGYDLRHLFIGSEGTLGVITAAVLKLFPALRQRVTAFAAVSAPATAMRLLETLQRATGQSVTSFELICRRALDFVFSTIPQTRDPLDTPSSWYLLIEVGTSGDDSGLEAIVENILADALEAGDLADAVLATSDSQRADFWRLRDSIPEAQRKVGASIKHDVSVPLSQVPTFLERATAAVTAVDSRVRVCPFGHVGDGNIHFNLSQPVDMDGQAFIQAWADYNRIVHDIVHELGGSVSAEHGIGQLKIAEMARYKDPVALALMHAIKRALDPDRIMNPGKILPD